MKYLLITFYFLLTITSNGKAQNLYFGIGSSYIKVYQPEYYTSKISKGGLGLNESYQFNTYFKYLLSGSPINITGRVSYLPMRQKGYRWDTVNPWDCQLEKIQFETSLSILTTSVGIDYLINPGTYSLYVSLDALFNSFGETKLIRTPPFSTLYNNSATIYSSKTRYGLGIGAGIVIHLLTRFDLDVSAKYNFMNLGGKKDIETFGIIEKEENFNTHSITAVILFNIL